VAFGPLRLGDLPPGRHRVLKPYEVEELRKLTARRAPRRRVRR
jgi:16S rRNA U516 pseudouridylate synthase RsuA-like enzyme